MQIVYPHTKVSREVTAFDLPRVIKEAEGMINFCLKPKGNVTQIFALAHPQIDDQDPLAFFVTNTKKIVVNPVIINHTNATVDSVEGCVTFPEEAPITVQRHHKCVVKYQLIQEGDLTDFIEEDVKGQTAKVFQHEIDHIFATYIYKF